MRKIKKNRSPNFDLSVANRIKNLLTEHRSIGKGLIVALKNNNQRLANELNDKWYKKNADGVATRLKKDYNADINAFDKVQQELLNMSQYFVDELVSQFTNWFNKKR